MKCSWMCVSMVWLNRGLDKNIWWVKLILGKCSALKHRKFQCLSFYANSILSSGFLSIVVFDLNISNKKKEASKYFLDCT